MDDDRKIVLKMKGPLRSRWSLWRSRKQRRAHHQAWVASMQPGAMAERINEMRERLGG